MLNEALTNLHAAFSNGERVQVDLHWLTRRDATFVVDEVLDVLPARGVAQRPGPLLPGRPGPPLGRRAAGLQLDASIPRRGAAPAIRPRPRLAPSAA